MPRKQGLAEQDALAARYRAEGWSYDAIATELGYANNSGAVKAVQRALARSHREPAAEARHLELNALHELSREAWAVLRRPHLYVSQGRVVAHPETDQPLHDDGPVLMAIGKLLDIQARRAKLLGLDAPTQARVEVVTESIVDAEIRRLEEALSDAAPGNGDRRATGEASTAP